MIRKLTVDDRLEFFAGLGETSAFLKLWKPTISRLRKKGFNVIEIAPTDRQGEFYCEIDWKEPQGIEAQQLLDYTIKTLQSNCKINF